MANAIVIFEDVLSEDEELEIKNVTESDGVNSIEIDVYLMCQFCHIILDLSASDILVGYQIRDYYTLTPFLMGSMKPVLIFEGDLAVLRKIQQYAESATAAVYAIESVRQLGRHALDLCEGMKGLDLNISPRIQVISADDVQAIFKAELEKIKRKGREYYFSVSPAEGSISSTKS